MKVDDCRGKIHDAWTMLCDILSNLDQCTGEPTISRAHESVFDAIESLQSAGESLDVYSAERKP